MFSPRKTLGLAVTEQGITVVQPGATGGAKTAELAYTQAINVAEPEALGKELKRVLSERGIGGGRCVIGLSAAWLVAREKQLPPADQESLRGMLAIAAEREFASGAGDLAFDYCAATSDRGSIALLAAAPRQIVDSLASAARAAGLSVAAVTSSTLALAGSSRGDLLPGGRLVLCLGPNGAELAAQVQDGPQTFPRLLRNLHVPLDGSPQGLDRLGRELQRVLSLAPPPQDTQSPRELVIWDSLGLEKTALESVGRSLGLPVRICRLPADVPGLGQTPLEARFAQAAALAVGMGASQNLDFLHSRLQPPAPSRFSRRNVRLAAVGAAVLAIFLALGIDYAVQKVGMSGSQSELDSLQASAKQARKVVDDFAFTRGWHDRRPEVLDALAEIATVFPDDRCWATSIRVKEDLRVEMSIKATDPRAAQKVLDRLMASPRLTDVTHGVNRNTSEGSSEVVFEVHMKYRGGR